ncbi:MAG: peptide-methionine (S)-S-oxide reductase [Thermoanaerobaculia bacterium]
MVVVSDAWRRRSKSWPVYGRTVTNPAYKAVSSGATGHIEAVEIVYGPRRASRGLLPPERR